MKRIFSLLLALSLIILTLSACGVPADTARGETEKITFVLDWTPNTNHTGLYVAEAKGYFKDAGLEVEIVQPPEDGATVLVASGKAEFGVTAQDSIAPALIGDSALPVTAVAAIIQHNTSGIISRAGEGISVPKGMEGKKYATWNSPVELATIKEVVKADGGDFSKIQLIPSTVTDEIAALSAKSVDAIWIYYAWTGVNAEVKGFDADYFAFADIDPVFDFYTPIIISSNKYLEENPETAKKFMDALSRGYRFAIENPDEAAEILCTAVPELDAELVLKSQQYLADKYQAKAEYWGQISAERWNNFYSWINDNNLLGEEKLPLDTAFSNEYLPKQVQ